MIDRSFATHRGVHLRQQCGRHLHKIDTALIAGGSESGQIADHSSAERQQGGEEEAPEQRGRDASAQPRAERLQLLDYQPLGQVVGDNGDPRGGIGERSVERERGEGGPG